jgi:hypothetical protein
MLYVCPTPAQVLVAPAIKPGCAGMLDTVTASVRTIEFPQALVAITVMLPACALEPAVAAMLAVVEDPDQPVGNVQV